MKIFKKKYKIIIPSLFVFGLVLVGLYGGIETKQTQVPEIIAQSCSTTGNLSGWIDTENVGRIFVNTDSWNSEHPSDVSTYNFGVEYDRQSGVWSGRGWAEGPSISGGQAAGWVDFSYDQINDLVLFESPASNASWGNWAGEVDVSDISYSAQTGIFEGIGLDRSYSGGVLYDNQEDDPIGSGDWTFANLEFVGSTCPENVNLFLDGTPFLHSTSCPIDNNDIPIQWTSENVSDCESVGSLWSNISRSTQNTGTTVHPSSDITDINQPVLFKLVCTGDYSGNDVEGVAIASCGTPLCDPDTEDCELGIIKPILIET